MASASSLGSGFRRTCLTRYQWSQSSISLMGPLNAGPFLSQQSPEQSKTASSRSSGEGNQNSQSVSVAADRETSSAGTSTSSPGATVAQVVEILLFAPNLVDYTRVLLTVISFALVPSGAQHARLFSLLYCLNFLLDGLDGLLARKLNQRSAFGAFLDVVIDNSLRSLMWHRALPQHWCAALIPCVEWLVFACTHSQAVSSAVRTSERRNPWDQRASDWRESFLVAPWWVRTVMSSGFKNPAGCLAIAGIHFLPLWIWMKQHHSGVFPLLSHWALGLVLVVGRGIGLAVEAFVLRSHVLELLYSDAESHFRTGKGE